METILEVEDLRVYYKSILGDYKAVDGASCKVYKNEIYGVAGESGCGKSTLVEGILKLIKPPGYIKSGKVTFEGVELLSLDEDKLREIRWKRLSYIPQGSMNSLNPVLRIKEQMTDATMAHVDVPEKEAERMALSALKDAGLPVEVVKMYPHELSGGMKQRVIIATAVTLKPSLVVADEPVTALDVVAQRLNLQSIADLRDRFGMAVILVAHDMAVHAEVVDRLAIMYAGKIAEIGPVHPVFADPLHPYTRGLIMAIPSLEKRIVKSIPGFGPSPLNWPLGCRFHPRCPRVMDICREEEPTLREVSPGRYVACHLFG